MKKSLARLGTVFFVGLLTLGLVLGNIRLAQLDPSLVRTRPTLRSLAPTATFYPTAKPETPPAASATPPSTPTPRSALIKECARPDGWLAYSVEPGDTLYSLAWRAQTTVHVLRQNNCLGNDQLVRGEVIYLPPGAVSKPTAPAERCGPPLHWRVAHVNPGDTLYRLAVNYGTTVAEIRWANCIAGNSIYVGQPLYLPPYMIITPTWTPSATATATPPTFTPTPSLTPSATATITPSITVTPSLTPAFFRFTNSNLHSHRLPHPHADHHTYRNHHPLHNRHAKRGL